MPFKSKKQAAKCYAMKERGESGSWNCDEWSKKTDFKHIPKKKKKRDECMEDLNKIESDLLKEWDEFDDSNDWPTGQPRSMEPCPASGCTHGIGHGGSHVTDDADLIPGSSGPRDTGFVNADRIADAADSMDGCTCIGQCIEACPCANGCRENCDCICSDEAGPFQNW